jgi:hypothetical protein
MINLANRSLHRGLKVPIAYSRFVPCFPFIIVQCRIYAGAYEFAKFLVGESAKLLDPLLAQGNAAFVGDMERNHVLNALNPQKILPLAGCAVKY